MRKSAIGLIHRQLLQLARLLSLSAYWQKPNPEFLQALASAANRIGAEGKKALDRNPNEPWRQFINTMIARLPRHDASNNAIQREDAPTYQRSVELLADLRILYDSLIACGQKHAAEYSVQPLMRIVQTFGFHLAVLDVRQNSAFHDRAVEQLLKAAGFERLTSLSGAKQSDWSCLRRSWLPSDRLHARCIAGCRS